MARANVAKDPASTRSGRRRRSLRLGAGLGALGLSAGLLAAPGSASVAPRATSQLQQGLAFYRGKTLLIICGGAAGGLYDLEGRNIVQALGSYLHATVEVEDIVPGNTIPAQDAAASATPNGLTVGFLNVVNDISQEVTNTPGLNFNPERVAFVGAAGPSISAWVSSPTSPYTTFDSVVKSSTPVTILDVTQGSGNVTTRVTVGVFGINAKIISGYPNPTTEAAGFERGDGEVFDTAFSDAVPLVQGGKARALLLGAAPPKGFPGASTFAGVPTLSEFAKSHPPKTKKQKTALAALIDLSQTLSAPIMFAPSAIPPARLAALRAGFKYAEYAAQVKQLELNEGLTSGYSSGPIAKAQYIQALVTGKAVASYLVQG